MPRSTRLQIALCIIGGVLLFLAAVVVAVGAPVEAAQPVVQDAGELDRQAVRSGCHAAGLG